MDFNHRDSGVRDYQRQGMGFITHHEVKQRLTGDEVRVVIVGKFGMGDVVCPRSGIVSTEDLKISLDFLVYPFGFSI